MRIKGRTILSSSEATKLLKGLQTNKYYTASILDALRVSAYYTDRGIRIWLRTDFPLTDDIAVTRWFTEDQSRLQEKVSGFIGRNLTKALELKSLVKPKQDLEDLVEQQLSEDDEEFLCFIEAKEKELNITSAFHEMSSSVIQRWLFLIAEYRVKYLQQKEVA